MIPLYDDNPTRRLAIVTIAIVALCIAAFLWQMSLGEMEYERAVFGFGFIPAVFFSDAALSPDLVRVPKEATVLTSMFLHGDVLHIGGNMLYLWIFGNNVEDAMSRPRFIAFYTLCGVAAAFAQAFAEPSSEIPMIGASGAISGVLGAYLLLYPRATVVTLVPLGIILTTFRLPAIVVLGFYILIQVVSALLTPAGQPGVAWWAHIGGFSAGILLIPVFKDRDIPFFAPPRAVQPVQPTVNQRRGPWG